jgi:hypothetical protein
VRGAGLSIERAGTFNGSGFHSCDASVDGFQCRVCVCVCASVSHHIQATKHHAKTATAAPQLCLVVVCLQCLQISCCRTLLVIEIQLLSPQMFPYDGRPLVAWHTQQLPWLVIRAMTLTSVLVSPGTYQEPNALQVAAYSLPYRGMPGGGGT